MPSLTLDELLMNVSIITSDRRPAYTSPYTSLVIDHYYQLPNEDVDDYAEAESNTVIGIIGGGLLSEDYTFSCCECDFCINMSPFFVRDAADTDIVCYRCAGPAHIRMRIYDALRDMAVSNDEIVGAGAEIDELAPEPQQTEDGQIFLSTERRATFADLPHIPNGVYSLEADSMPTMRFSIYTIQNSASAPDINGYRVIRRYSEGHWQAFAFITTYGNLLPWARFADSTHEPWFQHASRLVETLHSGSIPLDDTGTIEIVQACRLCNNAIEAEDEGWCDRHRSVRVREAADPLSHVGQAFREFVGAVEHVRESTESLAETWTSMGVYEQNITPPNPPPAPPPQRRRRIPPGVQPSPASSHTLELDELGMGEIR